MLVPLQCYAMNIRQFLAVEVVAAMQRAGAPEGASPIVQPSSRPEFGDYQANGAMGVAKALRVPPRAFAERIVKELRLGEAVERIEIAGPGFINITLSKDWLGAHATRAVNDARLAVASAAQPQTIVVDYSSPNLAKEMHVGHLRSTIIGDAVVRVLQFLGHRVIKQNHVGDWGTQFGMLIAYIEQLRGRDGAQLSMALEDLETFYRNAKQLFDSDPAFADTARAYVVQLQQGDAHCVALWRQFIDISLGHCERLYTRLGVTLTRDDVKPESAYNDDLPRVMDDLRQQKLLSESEGAQCVFLDEFKGKEGEPLPVIVQKSDGGYLYATTDLAAIRHRVGILHADRILYFVDARQSLHLKQVFAVARRAGFAHEAVSMEHHPFGTMMGEDGKPFKTRSGGTVKLNELLEEAEQRALAVVNEKNATLSDAQRRDIAHAVGIGAVKYADLSKNRINDYIFSWNTMLALDGNTAPYLLYAYARIASIFRKAEIQAGEANQTITINQPQERHLVLMLLRFSEVVDTVGRECYPNLLCSYLYDVAGSFMQFYEACPVLKADEPVRGSRLALCRLSAATLQQGLRLLGINTIEQM